MDCLVQPVVDKAVDYLVQPVGRQLGYLYNYGDKIEELEKWSRQIEDRRMSIGHQVEEDERNGKNIKGSVTDWLEKSQKTLSQVDEFLRNEGHLETGCSHGFPNLKLRHFLGRKATKMSSQCDQLLREAPDFGGLSFLPKPEAAEAALYDSGYEPFKSSEAVMEKVLNALRDPTAKMIGISGQGGVGKTTLVKAVARKAMAEKLFSVAVIATITSTPDVIKIQGELAEMLGLRLDDESPIGRAGRLRQRLKKEKNALVILDDLWAGFDLHMLGILFNDDDISQMTVKDTFNASQDTLKTEKSPGDFKGCKILVTSRSKEIMSREMDIKVSSIFPLGGLEREEAVKLFNKVAEVSEEDSELQLLSSKIANRCKELPMAIVTAAKALRNNKNKFAWESELEQMERQEVVEALKPVEFSTKLSYDHMQSEELKSFFLLCARISKDPSIADLVKYCIGLGLFQGVYTVKEARDRTHVFVNKLKDSSLLLNARSSDQVTMHDLVRDAALSIALKEQDIFSMRYGKLDEWPDKENFERYTTISLHHCNIYEGIPENLNCPRLNVFHVESNNPSFIIPDNLFEGMGELRVLILIGIDLSSLPSSIKSLKKLRMLCLEQCDLAGNISIIGELKKLRVLSLSGSKFKGLPSEFGQLDKLQLCDISNCPELRVIPPHVISNWISLEELYMENLLIQWGVEEQTSQNEIACLYELWHLQHLKRLDMHVQDAATLPRSLSYDKLDGYKIAIGLFDTVLFEDFKKCCMFEASRALALQLKKGNDFYLHKGIIKMLFKSVDHLFLGELDVVQNVINELNLQGFPCLKHLTIFKNVDIQYIINSMELGKPMMAFPKLESMYLYELRRMEKICNSSLTDTSFCNLRSIKISICSHLKNLFPFFMVGHLTKLETIEVSECDSLQEIVSECDSLEDKIEFPQLHTMTLHSLRILTSFCTTKNMLPISGKDEISVADEQSFTCVPVLFNINVSVQNLTQLNVKDCDKLMYLFSVSMVKNLGNLQSLSVERCAMMKHIFNSEDNRTNKEWKGIEVFPQLKKMEVTCMKELETIWYDQASLQSFCCLDYVIVKDCNKLTTIFPNYMVGRFSSLGRLEVMYCKLVEKIFDLEDSKQIDDRSETNLWNLHIEMLPKLKHIWSRDPKRILYFKNLHSVQVMGCSELENVFPFSVANGLSKLEYIRVSTCPKMKEIVSNEGSSDKNKIKFEFHQLTTIALQQLPKLTSFYREEHSIEFKALKQLYLIRCDKLVTEKSILSAVKQVISTLEAVGIGPKEMEWFQDSIGNDVYQLHNVKTLYLDGLRSMETPFWFLQRTPYLENLFLVRCFNKEMLSRGSLDAHEKIGTVVHLKSLRLWYFHVAQNIGFLNHPIVQRVEELYLVDCSGLITLFPSLISFTHLTYLEVSRCPRLKKLMTLSTAKSLFQLIGMKITQCGMIEEIVTKEENKGIGDIVFSKLKSIELVELINLKCFCNYEEEGLAFKFPSLEKVILRDCFKLEYFCTNITCPKLKEVNVEEKEKGGYWNGDLNATIKNIFEDMVFVQYTEDLRIFQHQELEKMCQGRVPMPDNFFKNIKSLELEERTKEFSSITSADLSKLFSYLKNLEKLKIGFVPIKVLFEIDESTNMNGDFFPLKALTLYGLPSLESVWSKDPNGFVSFPNLQEVVVSHCEMLETLLPVSIAKTLVKLEVSECYALVKIVGKAEVEAFKQSNTFPLPSLTSLLLDDLPELQCFCPGISILECPKLGDLRVIKCTKLDVFTPEVPSHQGAHGHEDAVGTSSHRQPLFLIEKVIQNLETLWLNKKMTSISCLRKYDACILHKLKVLRLFFGDDDNDAATILPFEFLQKLPNLKSLSIEHFNSMKELLPSQKTKEIDSKKMLKNLEDLQVKSCPSLTILAPSLVSFCNLKQLSITECHGLVSLLSSSVAKSLEQLEKIIIERCKSLKQIVCQDTAVSASNEIIFEKLAVIKLISLSSLVTFCSANVALHFPMLQVASINDCPMMKSFSQGVIWAPNFMAIQASSDPYELHYAKDLNSTVEILFCDWVHDVEEFRLGDHPELEDIWLSIFHFHEMSFSKLKSLVVEGCKICSIIPFHLLPYLGNLESLEVRKCVSVKTIFDVNNIQVKDSEPPPHFTLCLKKLILEELPNLEHVWNEDPQGILSLQCLQQVCVNGCSIIKSLFPTSVAIDKLEKLEVKCCEGLEEIISKDKTEASNKVFIFTNLSSLTLWELPELKYFYWGLHHLKWPQLNLLNVYHCCKFRTFTTEFPSHLHEARSTNEHAIALAEKVVPKLEELLLSENDITMLSHEGLGAPFFDGIRYLKLMCYHGGQTTKFPYRFFLKVRNVEKLLVGCSGFREIFPSMPQLDGSESIFLEAFGFLSHLKKLELNYLRELVSIGLEYSWHKIPPGLESMRVVGCSSLIYLVPRPVDFSNLVDLTVTECHKMEYLFTSSTARTLTFLKNMSISRCDSMKEIVAEEVDDLVIMSYQLKTLALYSLPKLEFFYSGSSVFNFVCLREVSIDGCGRMKVFCQKDGLKTPQLPCDLNAGVQEAHNNKTPFYICEQSSQVDEDSLERDKGTKVHRGAFFRKLDNFVLGTRKYISNLMDRMLPRHESNARFSWEEPFKLESDFLFFPTPREYLEDIGGQGSHVDEDTTERHRDPDVFYQGAVFRKLDFFVLVASKFLSTLMDRMLPPQEYNAMPSIFFWAKGIQLDLQEGSYVPPQDRRGSMLPLREYNNASGFSLAKYSELDALKELSFSSEDLENSLDTRQEPGFRKSVDYLILVSINYLSNLMDCMLPHSEYNATPSSNSSEDLENSLDTRQGPRFRKSVDYLMLVSINYLSNLMGRMLPNSMYNATPSSSSLKEDLEKESPLPPPNSMDHKPPPRTVDRATPSFSLKKDSELDEQVMSYFSPPAH